VFSLIPRRREGLNVPARREFTPFDLLRHEFATLFDRAFPVWPFEPTWEVEPWGFEMEEKENEVVLKAEMPGFELKEIEVLNVAAIKDAKQGAENAADILRRAGFEVSTESPEPRDSDAREIVKAAEQWNADVVVLGSHGRRGFDRLTMGSVSEHVALHARCSVQVIRPAENRTKKATKGAKS